MNIKYKWNPLKGLSFVFGLMFLILGFFCFLSAMGEANWTVTTGKYFTYSYIIMGISFCLIVYSLIRFLIGYRIEFTQNGINVSETKKKDYFIPFSKVKDIVGSESVTVLYTKDKAEEVEKLKFSIAFPRKFRKLIPEFADLILEQNDELREQIEKDNEAYEEELSHVDIKNHMEIRYHKKALIYGFIAFCVFLVLTFLGIFLPMKNIMSWEYSPIIFIFDFFALLFTVMYLFAYTRTRLTYDDGNIKARFGFISKEYKASKICYVCVYETEKNSGLYLLSREGEKLFFISNVLGFSDESMDFFTYIDKLQCKKITLEEARRLMTKYAHEHKNSK